MKEKLLFNLHEQFANNQVEHDNKFTSIFIATLTLFATYGISYAMNLEWMKNSYNIKSQVVCSLAILVGIVLTYLSVVTLTGAKAFRRDQYLNNKIRKFYLSSEEHTFYFKDYTGEKKNCIKFIPDFLFIRLLFLLALFLIVFISVFLLMFYEEENLSGKILTSLSFVSLLIFILYTWCKKHKEYSLLKCDCSIPDTTIDQQNLEECLKENVPEQSSTTIINQKVCIPNKNTNEQTIIKQKIKN